MRVAVLVLVVLVTSFVCEIGVQSPFYPVPDVPPRLSLIQISTPDANNRATISGAAGSVPGGSTVLMVVLETGHYATVQAAADGSFSQTLFAPAGTSLLIKVDPLGIRLRTVLETGGGDLLIPLAGTIARVPERQLASPGVPFAGAGPTGFANGRMTPPSWTMEGSITTSALQSGGVLAITGTLEVRSPALSGAGEMRVSPQIFLERLAGPDGFGAAARNVFSSTVMTPTGLPIERLPLDFGRTSDARAILTRTGSDIARTTLNLSLPLAADLPAGYYRPYLLFFFEGVPLEQLPQPLFQTDNTGRRPGSAAPFSLHLPIIRVGQPATPRLFWTLFTDTLSNGSRGVRAIEDRNRFGQSPRLLTQSESFIIPRINPETRQPAVYRLDPFALTLSVGDRGIPPNPPLIPLRFPSGSLTARIQRPDGSTIVIGPAPFAQARVRAPLERNNFAMSTGGGDITDAYELSTMDPRFEVSFDRDGRYLITLDGWVEDIWGNRWNGSGTYEVFVASPLSLDSAVLPGTPFEVGDVLAPGVVITPPVSAEVEVRVRLAPGSDPARLIDRTIRGRANRFGYFSPLGAGVRLDQPGEYRVDITASYADAQGNRRMGARTWGGVVAPRSPSIIAHGLRGIEGQPQGTPRTQWFFRTQTGEPVGGSHVNFPFHSGDVIWAQKSDAVVPHIAFQDPAGGIVRILRNLGLLDENQAAIGEIGLTSYSPRRGDPLLDPFNGDVWGCAYRSVQRPLVRIRELIGEVGLPATYWRFNDRYAGQIGAGRRGDLPNDFKFQYGGAVLRGTALPTSQYAIYGLLFVLVPDNDPGGGTRVFPPFQGNGGAASGGPIMKLKGQDIDLFIHLTGVRPGTVLDAGDSFSLTGAVGPPLPAQISATITGPNGSTRQVSGRANRVGYFYHPEHDFVAAEPGIYTVDLRVTFDGQTSAGQVSQPFPTGDVLGSANGRFFVYVVPRDSAPLAVTLPETMPFEPLAQLDITANATPGLSLTSGHVTTMMPGFLLQTNSLTSSAGSVSYRYDPAPLTPDFPNLDDGEVITISLLGQTADSAGNVSYAARVIASHGRELYNLTPTGAVANVSAASFTGPTLASESIVAAFGAGLATTTQTAGAIPLPTSLAGTTITVRDSAGTERLAPLFFVSPDQVNYQMPPGTMPGLATVTINGGGELSRLAQRRLRQSPQAYLRPMPMGKV